MFKDLTQTVNIGKNLIFLPTCHSTNDYSLGLIKEGKAQHGHVIITDHQTHGKGQPGNKWISSPGKNLTFSIILNISFYKSSELFRLNILVSIGIQRYLQTLANGFKIKWPNDIYYKTRKAGGVLIENIIGAEQWSVVGIGLNVNQTDFQYLNATSLSMIAGESLSLAQTLEGICIAIEAEIMASREKSYAQIRQEYLMMLYKFNEKNTFKSSEDIFEGKIVDVDEVGRIGIITHEGKTYFDKKEISFLNT